MFLRFTLVPSVLLFVALLAPGALRADEKGKEPIPAPKAPPEKVKPGSDNPGVLQSNPPKESVKGRVTAYDAETGKVTISVGKDDGLEKGHTLEVYRLKPKPTYVGMLLIIEVKKTESIGKFILKRGVPAVDDEVASDILGK